MKHALQRTLCMLAITSLVCTASLFAAGAQEGTAGADEPVTIEILFSHANAAYTSGVTDWSTNVYANKLSEITGYDLQFEFGPHVEYNQFLTVRFASGDLPDIIRTPGVDSLAHPGAVDQGIFTEMMPIIQKNGPNILKNIPENLWDAPYIAKNGKVYGIPVLSPYAATRVVYVRQDWLDRAGMKTPTTVDEYLAFYEWVKTADANNNGNPNDEYGLYVRENMAYSELFFGAYGVYPTSWRYVNGEFVPEIIIPEMKEAIAFWKMMYDKGYINPNLFTNKAADWVAGIYNGQGGTWLHDFGNYETSWLSQMVDPGNEIAMIAPPKGPGGDKFAPRGARYYFGMVFPTTSKVVEDSVKFIDKCWSLPDAETFFLWGIEGRNYTIENGKVNWDGTNPNNATNAEWIAYRLSLNPTVYHYSTPKILEVHPLAADFKVGMNIADQYSFVQPNIFMPQIEVFKSTPELVPGFGAGTLFLDMFAKVVTGREDLDTSFNTFVTEWKKRGGDEAIKQATDWYKSFNNIR